MLDQLAMVAEMALGPTDLQTTRFDLLQLADASANQARARWPEHTILYDHGPYRSGAPVQVCADRRRVAELLASLLDNAGTFSPPGSTVELSAGLGNGSVRLSVHDQGIGIPADELESIFHCFTRGSNVTRAGEIASRGLGVGLFLACATASQSGGQLWAESVPDQGSTFHLTLPHAS